MGNLDGGTFPESGLTSSSGSCSPAAEIEQQIKYDRELHEKKFAAPAYKEIRTRKNGLKANGGVMAMNGTTTTGYKVIRERKLEQNILFIKREKSVCVCVRECVSKNKHMCIN